MQVYFDVKIRFEIAHYDGIHEKMTSHSFIEFNILLF
jgi:hypothetical protein